MQKTELSKTDLTNFRSNDILNTHILFIGERLQSHE